MKKLNVTETVKHDLTNAIREALDDVLSNLDSDEAIESYLKEFLEGSNCHLTFDEEGVDALIGIGTGDAVRSFQVEIVVDGAGGIAAARTFITELEAACREEEAKLK